MLYLNEFPKSKKIFCHTETTEKSFSVIIYNNKQKKEPSPYSLAIAAKPFIHFASLFGLKIVSYNKHNVVDTKLVIKFYALLVIIAYILLAAVIVPPLSWRDTKSDVPLNILTITFGLLNIFEAVYSVFSITILNNTYYIQLFNKLDDIDNDFCISQTIFKRRRIISILFVLLPIKQVFCTFWLRKFYIRNVGAHTTFFFIMLQASIIYYFIITIYVKLLMLNILLAKIVKKKLSRQKKIMLQNSISDIIIKVIWGEPKLISEEVIHRCWFELMQIYDKVADCLYLFNTIYRGQVFILYNAWLLCTILAFCRSLTPSLEHKDLVFSDIFLYSSINCRALVPAVMGEMFKKERNKTIAMLVQVLLTNDDDQYHSQVKTMIMLVSSRKLEISANVFTINVPTVMNFAGRIISYTVLMIQYFYKHFLINGV